MNIWRIGPLLALNGRRSFILIFIFRCILVFKLVFNDSVRNIQNQLQS
jgi:hypothetical protein